MGGVGGSEIVTHSVVLHLSKPRFSLDPYNLQLFNDDIIKSYYVGEEVRRHFRQS